MKRRNIVRLQLFLLVAVVLLLVGRFLVGSPHPPGLIVFTDIEPGTLQHSAFRVEQPVRFAVAATGSFEAADATAETPLAAYAWLLRRDDREVVWAMQPGEVTAGRGTLATAADTLVLEPGTYDAFFASYGSTPPLREESLFKRIIDPAQPWRSEAGKWQFILRPTDGKGTGASRLGHEDEDERAPCTGPCFWTTAPTRNHRTSERLFEVQRPLRLRLYALGEVGEARSDYGWIEDAATGERLWEMTADNTTAAGGGDRNRRFADEVALATGIYRAVYRTDRSHAAFDWQTNPPFDPFGWGLTLQPTDPADVSALTAFDPWHTRVPLASLVAVPNDAHRTATLEVSQPVRVVVYAIGELLRGRCYDCAWIEDARGKEVWKMSLDKTEPAGGADKNRQQTAFLTLEPGHYTLHYKTDDSHAYGDWNDDAPTYPMRWGVTLFPVASTLSEGAILVRSNAETWAGSEPALPEAPEAPLPPLGEGKQLVDASRLGNEAQVEHEFELEEAAQLRISALGEISRGGRYDYGWIEDDETGETVWEMTLENTRPGGGSDRNRRFDGLVRLGPGQYVLHFRTDGSHAYDDFGDDAPDAPASWGIKVERVKQDG